MSSARFERAALIGAQPGAVAHETFVRFQDVDAAGVLFYGRLFDYLHDAYVTLLMAEGCDLPRMLAEERWLAPIAHAEVHYLGPVRFGDRLRITVARALVAEQAGRARLGYQVRRLPGDALVAVGQVGHVFLDGNRSRRPIPAEIARALVAISGEVTS